MTFELFLEPTKSEEEIGWYPQFLTNRAMKQRSGSMDSELHIYI